MNVFTLLHPTDYTRNQHVRVYEDEPQEAEEIRNLFAMVNGIRQRHGSPDAIGIRASTDKEIAEIDGLEQVGFYYPRDSKAIAKLVFEWATPLTIQEILHIVISECRNSCSTAEYSREYLTRHYKERIENVKNVWALLKILNYAAIREDSQLLYFYTE